MSIEVSHAPSLVEFSSLLALPPGEDVRDDQARRGAQWLSRCHHFGV
jgi:hypothetical protein